MADVVLFLYNLIICFVAIPALKLIAVFSPKIKYFVESRKTIFEVLEKNITASDKTIWFHVASQGEYEQGLPVLEKIKEKFPNHKIVLTFFSSSGSKIKERNTVADVVTYMPLDTLRNVKKFISVINPEKVFFVKYDFWPNYLIELKKRDIPTYLISGIFRENQWFFKWYGGLGRKLLHSFTYFFLQNKTSKDLLTKLGIQNTIISGDTRFDRVSEITKTNNSLDFISEFKNNHLLVVAGCSWEKDEELLVKYINSTIKKAKFIIAPRHINLNQILELKEKIVKKTILFSEKDNNPHTADVLIIDEVVSGILIKTYSYADVAFVGGGFGKGIHNILEPATFGVPVMIGPIFFRFAEAVALVYLEGAMPILDIHTFTETLDLLLENENIRAEKGEICRAFVKENTGASEIILENI